MAIVGPADLPVVLKLRTEPIKKYVFTRLGHPVVDVELTEDQLETIIRTRGDWVAGYFPREQRLAVFNTIPLQSTYPLPADAYWVQEVTWDPVTTRIDDIFGAESFLFNIGNISGIQNILLDYHLLQAYRKFSQKELGTYGTWEVINEGKDGDATQQKIRLYPTPKGAFPVLVLYIPVVTAFRSPQARQILMDAILAEAKTVLGTIRRKIANMPSPTGGTLSLDGEALIAEGNKELEDITKKAIELGEPMPVIIWLLLWFSTIIMTAIGSFVSIV